MRKALIVLAAFLSLPLCTCGDPGVDKEVQTTQQEKTQVLDVGNGQGGKRIEERSDQGVGTSDRHRTAETAPLLERTQPSLFDAFPFLRPWVVEGWENVLLDIVIANYLREAEVKSNPGGEKADAPDIDQAAELRKELAPGFMRECNRALRKWALLARYEMRSQKGPSVQTATEAKIRIVCSGNRAKLQQLFESLRPERIPETLVDNLRVLDTSAEGTRARARGLYYVCEQFDKLLNRSNLVD